MNSKREIALLCLRELLKEKIIYSLSLLVRKILNLKVNMINYTITIKREHRSWSTRDSYRRRKPG
jgi:hypothetical protein